MAKRGRPPLIRDDIARFLAPDGTRRTALNYFWHGVALTALGYDANAGLPPRFRWLEKKRTILCELGRFNHPPTIRNLAKGLCKQRPLVTDAVERLRLFRVHGT